MTTSADPNEFVVVDTNVLLAATDRSRAAHDAATGFLNNDGRRLALTPQIIREYVAVTTRPVEASGFGLPGKDAVANVQQFLDDMVLLPENISTTRRLLALVGERAVTGKQIHDANVVAVALTRQASTIVTDNTRHFSRFADLIDIESLHSG
ncbi:MAG: PIN domain-containing protein [Nocardioides sp.]|uniref:type II toxin-antitoxin system VapC family toxin n=1 Tax=Nocardioides sp. TaxID=35761 RepID=UPI0039E43A34